MSQHPRISVIILSFNQKEKTLECLYSLLNLHKPSFQVVVWDNGSQDGTEEAVRNAFPTVWVHYSPENLGVAGGRNAAADLAIRLFGATHLLFLDNDIVVEPDFVQALFQPFCEDLQVGQTQAKLLFKQDRNRINDGGGAQISYIFWRVRPVGYNEIDMGQHNTPRECVSCGGAMMVRVDIFEKIGGFDLVFGPFGPEDLDFSLRLQKSGFKAMYIPQAVGYHEDSHTFGSGYTENYARHKAQHWIVFMQRHGSPTHIIGFILLGVPYLAFRVILREGRRGNLRAIRGLLNGTIDYFRSFLISKSQP